MNDSIDKIIINYFQVFALIPFSYKKKIYTPKPYKVSPDIFRLFECKNCGGCCPKFSLDYLPTEKHPYHLGQRIVNFNNKEYPIFSDIQKYNNSKHCKHLRRVKEENKSICDKHTMNPFSCDFELLRTSIFRDPSSFNYFSHRHYGRKWNLLRYTDLKRGGLCVIQKPSNVNLQYIKQEHIPDVIRKLERLKQWMLYFGLGHSIDKIIAYVRTGPHSKFLIVNPTYKKEGIFFND